MLCADRYTLRKGDRRGGSVGRRGLSAQSADLRDGPLRKIGMADVARRIEYLTDLLAPFGATSTTAMDNR